MLGILSAIYGLAVGLRNSLYDKGILRQIKIRRPVISIGNISAGGAGKTPLTILLSNLLNEELNISNAIIGRGYKKKKKGLILVSDGKNLLAGPEEAGDEMYLMAINTKAPVIACEKKFRAAIYVDENFHSDCLLVDDGFQHRKLKRDLDIVIIDNKTINNKGLLPKGRLREPIRNLNRADVIVLRDIEGELPLLNIKTKNTAITVCIESIYNSLFDKDNYLIDFNSFNKILCFSGLADNDQFTAMLKSSGISISGSIAYNDHHDYQLNDIKTIIAQCLRNGIKTCITTEKDFVKVQRYIHLFDQNSLNIYYPKLNFEITKGKDELKEKFRELFY